MVGLASNEKRELARKSRSFELCFAGKLTEEKNAEISALTGELKHLKKVSALTLKFEKETEQAQQETTKRKNQLEVVCSCSCLVNTTHRSPDQSNKGEDRRGRGSDPSGHPCS